MSAQTQEALWEDWPHVEWVKKEEGTAGDSKISSWDVRMVMSLASMGQAAGGRDKALRFICAGQRVLVRGRASVALGGVALRDVGEPGALLTSAQKLWERGGGGGEWISEETE